MELDLTRCKLNELYTVVKTDSLSPFVVSFRCPSPSVCHLCITDDGSQFWVKKIESVDIVQLASKANLESLTFCERIRRHLYSGNVSLRFQDDNGSPSVTMAIGTHPTICTMAVPKSDVNHSDELKGLLLSMAAHSSRQAKELDELTARCRSSRPDDQFSLQDGCGGGSLSSTRNTRAVKGRPKTGMSLINPSSKLQKTQKGIEFN